MNQQFALQEFFCRCLIFHLCSLSFFPLLLFQVWFLAPMIKFPFLYLLLFLFQSSALLFLQLILFQFLFQEVLHLSLLHYQFFLFFVQSFYFSIFDLISLNVFEKSFFIFFPLIFSSSGKFSLGQFILTPASKTPFKNAYALVFFTALIIPKSAIGVFNFFLIISL